MFILKLFVNSISNCWLFNLLKIEKINQFIKVNKFNKFNKTVIE